MITGMKQPIYIIVITIHNQWSVFERYIIILIFIIDKVVLHRVNIIIQNDGFHSAIGVEHVFIYLS